MSLPVLVLVACRRIPLRKATVPVFRVYINKTYRHHLPHPARIGVAERADDCVRMMHN
jgi:hypothetical protein